jgi:hypothetical protein
VRLIALAGVVGSIVWFLLQNRMLVHLSMHEEVIKLLEKEPILALDKEFAMSLELNTVQADMVKAWGICIKARRVMRVWIAAIFVAWIFAWLSTEWPPRPLDSYPIWKMPAIGRQAR